jgi:hypothetical protein
MFGGRTSANALFVINTVKLVATRYINSRAKMSLSSVTHVVKPALFPCTSNGANCRNIIRGVELVRLICAPDSSSGSSGVAAAK